MTVAPDMTAERKASFIEKQRRILDGDLFILEGVERSGSENEVENLFVSLCYSCSEIALWKHDTILYPRLRYQVGPNADMNSEIQADFNEARDVLDLSPRAAAALLRLCVQKLCSQVGAKGSTINEQIGDLVKNGLHPQVQRALDTVRVIGNEAVHPGTLDLRDDRETAAKLFVLVNRIAYDLITYPKELNALHDEKLTTAQKAQIAKRDGKATSSP